MKLPHQVLGAAFGRVRAPGARTAAPKVKNCRTGATMKKMQMPETAVPRMHEHTQENCTENFALNYTEPSVQLDHSPQLCMQHGGDRQIRPY